ncbi:MAG: amylo-alpha-1,6-glucosidase [Lachnospiraceae bacterium]|nr:amylo-alpha-1,6-glucosidase [Lachnospiraceae bacterium]
MSGKRITYRFGRNAFRNFEEGTAREWLLTNGIGGYANSTVCGDSSRTFSAYLIASLYPPVDRVLVLAKTHEELKIARGNDGFGESGCPAQPEELLWAAGASKAWADAFCREQQLAQMKTAGGGLRPEVSVGETDELCRDFAAQEYPGFGREGYRYLESFSYDVVPEYCYRTDGITVRKSIALEYGKNAAALRYEIVNESSRPAKLCVTPLFNYRPFGAVSSRDSLRFHTELDEGAGVLCLIPESAPEYAIRFSVSDGEYYDRSCKPTSMATPDYVYEENELYRIDVSNGFTGVDCHYTPYEVQISLVPGERRTVGMLCELIRREGGQENRGTRSLEAARMEDGNSGRNARAACLARAERIFSDCASRAEALLAQADVRDEFAGRLVLSADHFLAKRESTGKMTVLAGFPWFADWGRDTMIAFTGLTLASGRFQEAREVLESFAMYVSEGMLPNVFPNDAGEKPMYNTIDASLWYFYAVWQYLKYTTGLRCYDDETDRKNGSSTGAEKSAAGLCGEEQFVKETLYPVLANIFESYRDGTARYGIHMAEDGLIAGGSDLDQLTWMDVRVGEIVVTPRHGRAVEINALWYNALCCMEVLTGRLFGDRERAAEYAALAERAKTSFCSKFWNEKAQCLYDVIDGEENADESIRPNQIYAVSLPFTMLSEEQEEKIVRTVYEKLYTPYGLRSLAPGSQGYRGEYAGRLIDRDMAYHMGTAWGYLSGAFLTAWAKVFGPEEAKRMCLCFMDTMADGCLGGIAEIFDGDFACVSRGCYTQAWSVGEVLRAWRELSC